MARTALLGRLTWRVATVVAARDEAEVARTLVLDVPGWSGHTAGQHVDVRLTAADGYTAQRSYSIASAPAQGRLELTVQRIAHGEVSPYLVEVAQPGDQFEVRGPIGGYFTWDPEDPLPVLLVAGGSGIVPLMAMIRTRAAAGSRTPLRLIYSTRSPATAIYADELAAAADSSPGNDGSRGDDVLQARHDHGLDVTSVYTRQAPPGWPRPPGRLDGALLKASAWPAQLAPACYVCGPTGFVELVANLLVDQGHPADRIRTERFGGTT